MDDTSFDLLCKGLSPDEVKLFRKIVKEWCNGDENSFPVQLALLTRAQWLAAAQMPLVLQKIIAAFETKLADHQRQMAALVKSLGAAGDDKIKAFEETVAVHTGAMEKVAGKSCDHLDETEKFARGSPTGSRKPSLTNATALKKRNTITNGAWNGGKPFNFSDGLSSPLSATSLSDGITDGVISAIPIEN
jgi:hypothetical protein